MRLNLTVVIVLLLTSIGGIGGTIYFAGRAGDSAEAYRELRVVNRRLANNIEQYRSVHRKYRDINEQLEFNNGELQNNLESITRDLGSARRELGRLGIYIDRLEHNNRELETILLGIADRSGFKVDRDSGR